MVDVLELLQVLPLGQEQVGSRRVARSLLLLAGLLDLLVVPMSFYLLSCKLVSLCIYETHLSMAMVIAGV